MGFPGKKQQTAYKTAFLFPWFLPSPVRRSWLLCERQINPSSNVSAKKGASPGWSMMVYGHVVTPTNQPTNQPNRQTNKQTNKQQQQQQEEKEGRKRRTKNGFFPLILGWFYSDSSSQNWTLVTIRLPTKQDIIYNHHPLTTKVFVMSLLICIWPESKWKSKRISKG